MQKNIEKEGYHKWIQTLMSASITVMVGILLNLSINDHEKIARIDTRLSVLEDRSNNREFHTSIPKDVFQFPLKPIAILPKYLELPHKED